MAQQGRRDAGYPSWLPITHHEPNLDRWQHPWDVTGSTSAPSAIALTPKASMLAPDGRPGAANSPAEPEFSAPQWSAAGDMSLLAPGQSHTPWVLLHNAVSFLPPWTRVDSKVRAEASVRDATTPALAFHFPHDSIISQPAHANDSVPTSTHTATISTPSLRCGYEGCDSKPFTKASALTGHIDRKHKRPFKCSECGKSFGTKGDRDRHESTVHVKSAGIWVCHEPSCKRRKAPFSREDNYIRHMKQVHVKGIARPGAEKLDLGAGGGSELDEARESGSNVVVEYPRIPAGHARNRRNERGRKRKIEATVGDLGQKLARLQREIRTLEDELQRSRALED
ncbi:hypothetical protein B0T19DRAFT_436207 [Cercophora scortea]|uniref:C2H2-type domain-containing protein n=1 Tax=Cercophora scortea TaxID=314031 RepID=A0AAE0J328_9PEZI|nr:hypothetical protein B0T19DRAFT_436207 [Cercophora scortea]